MSFKKVGVAVAATAAILGGSFITASPAQALSLADTRLTGSLVINLDDLLTDLSSTMIDFDEEISDGDDSNTVLDASRFDFSTGSFASITNGSIKDLPIGAAFPVSGIDDFIEVQDTSGAVQFDLISLVNESFSPTTNGATFEANLRGFFRPTDQRNSTLDTFDARLSLGRNEAFISITPVPTPAAVLPGLLGMGTAVFRKKGKQEDQTLAAVETENQA